MAWTKLIGFTEHPDLARCEIDTFRYRVLHVAARITRGARQIRLRIDATWRWATRSPPPGRHPRRLHLAPDPPDPTTTKHPPALETVATRPPSQVPTPENWDTPLNRHKVSNHRCRISAQNRG